MSFIKGIQSTMIGSMPQLKPEDALKSLSEYPLSIPAWPQLPKKSFKEGMITQYSESFPGITVDEEAKRIWLERNENLINTMTDFYEQVVEENTDAFLISDEYASGLNEFIKNLQGKKIPCIKGHVTGPLTLGLGLKDNEGNFVWFDEQYRDIVLKGLSMKALWQIKQFKKISDNILIFFDEPILSALGTPAYIGIKDEQVIESLNEVITAVQKEGALAGVHCCGNMDWGLLAETKIDIIAFDAYFFGDKIALYPEQINKFLERGGILAWGIVPTSDPEVLNKETPDTLKEKYIGLLNLYEQKGIKTDLIKNKVMLTPSCGMGSGSLSIKDTETVLELLYELSKKLEE